MLPKIWQTELQPCAKPLKSAACSTVKSKVGVCRKCYGRNLATDRNVDVGEAVGTIAAQAIGEPGTQLTMRTFHTGGVAGGDDITQGLPRVEELFEARKPKHPGILAETTGVVHIAEEGGQRKITITDKDGMEEVYAIPYGAKLAVAEGQEIEKGDRLTEGSLNPHDIIRISGVRATQRYLVQQVLGVYKSQGVEINDKHIEVMVRQMMRKVRIDEAGDTTMLPGEYVDIGEFEESEQRRCLTAAYSRQKVIRFFWVLPKHPWQPIPSCLRLPSRKLPVYLRTQLLKARLTRCSALKKTLLSVNSSRQVPA